MTKTEQKVFDYAQSVEWDFEKVSYYISAMTLEEWCELNGTNSFLKADYFIDKYKPKDWREGIEGLNFLTITIPIDDYNRLRKLEIKQQIKKLKKELKGL